MSTRATLVAFGTAVAGLLVAAQAHAATICVTLPSDATCPNHTIRDAVAIAGPGDIVQVGAGTFHDNVLVNPGKDGLQIVGAGKLSTIVENCFYVNCQA